MPIISGPGQLHSPRCWVSFHPMRVHPPGKQNTEPGGPHSEQCPLAQLPQLGNTHSPSMQARQLALQHHKQVQLPAVQLSQLPTTAR